MLPAPRLTVHFIFMALSPNRQRAAIEYLIFCEVRNQPPSRDGLMLAAGIRQRRVVDKLLKLLIDAGVIVTPDGTFAGLRVTRKGRGVRLPVVPEQFGNHVNFTRVFGGQNEIIFQFAPSALYLLAAPSTPETARAEIIERAEAGDKITYTEAKEMFADSANFARLDIATKIVNFTKSAKFADLHIDERPHIHWTPPTMRQGQYAGVNS